MNESIDKFTLMLNSGSYSNENGDAYVGYGFTAYSPPPEHKIFEIEDLSVDENEVRELIRLIEDNDVSVAHFQDLIDDFCV